MLKQPCISRINTILLSKASGINLKLFQGNQLIFIFQRFYLFIFRERKRGRKKGKHQCVVASQAPPTGDLACNLGMRPDWESNQRPFGSQAGAQSTEPHQPGLS